MTFERPSPPLCLCLFLFFLTSTFTRATTAACGWRWARKFSPVSTGEKPGLSWIWRVSHIWFKHTCMLKFNFGSLPSLTSFWIMRVLLWLLTILFTIVDIGRGQHTFFLDLLPSISSFSSGKWRAKVMENKDWLMEQARWGSMKYYSSSSDPFLTHWPLITIVDPPPRHKANESLRPGKPRSHADIFGIEGSFRRLDDLMQLTNLNLLCRLDID